eukprot:TRINITY_DN594_c0_g1_i5.p1 TRINITY_DN594_c0_g1~~TRINITY_DN594_c0_g1_i5.p1  ORF type:complete len:477 (+),score=89.57 TRINITY_DN594_c0_g1_i5:270-1700(+)
MIDGGELDIGSLDISSKGIYDDAVKFEKRVERPCPDNDFNVTNRRYFLTVDQTQRPVDLGRAFIKITGQICKLTAAGARIGMDTVDTAGGLERIYSAWIYNAFSRISLSLGGTTIETVDHPAATMEMKKCLYMPWYSQVKGTYQSCGLFERDLGTDPAAGSVCGSFSYTTFTQCLNNDGKYEVMIPLGLLFESIKTLPFIPRKMFPQIALDRNPTYCTGIVSNLYTDVDAYNAADKKGRHYNLIDELSIVYHEYQMATPEYERYVNEQYNKNIVLTYRKWSCQSMNYNTKEFNTKLPLVPSKQGNCALVMGWYADVVAPTTRSKNAAGYLHDRLDLSDIRVSYGPTSIYPLSRLDDCKQEGIPRVQDYGIVGDTDNYPAYGNNIKRLYEMYKDSLNLFYNDESLAMPYPIFRDRHPYAVFDMSKFQMGGDETSVQMINASIRHMNGIQRNMICWLLSSEILVWDPIKECVVAMGSA